jgi:DNA polymerase III subunit epsilon
MSAQCSIEASIAGLVASGDYRVLQRLHLPVGPVNIDLRKTTSVGIVVDVETNGLDPSQHRIIELAVRRFRYDSSGAILCLDHPYSWVEDPGKALDPAITGLTGLTDETLAGNVIDDATATALFRSSEICIAHNASFDRRFVERRLPDCAGLAWACSLEEIDWRRRGFDGSGRSLGWLLSQCGYFHDAHQAKGDVDAVLAILQHRFGDGTPALAELLANAERPSWLVSATGAHFDVKDKLKGRGYRWNADESVWFRQISDADRAAELAWLAEHVYAPEFRPRTDAPSLREVTRFNRHA